MIKDKITIILIENNSSDAFLIKRQIKKILTKPNINCVSEFQALKEAIDYFQPDILLCDYQLSGFTGFEVLTYLSKNLIGILLVFITGTRNDEELAAQSILAGASGYILKKNMNSLHKKLRPFFEQIVKLRKRFTN